LITLHVLSGPQSTGTPRSHSFSIFPKGCAGMENTLLPPKSWSSAPRAAYAGTLVGGLLAGRSMRARGMLTADGSCMFSNCVIKYNREAQGGFHSLSYRALKYCWAFIVTCHMTRAQVFAVMNSSHLQCQCWNRCTSCRTWCGVYTVGQSALREFGGTTKGLSRAMQDPKGPSLVGNADCKP
jgi:hypothetical protein